MKNIIKFFKEAFCLIAVLIFIFTLLDLYAKSETPTTINTEIAKTYILNINSKKIHSLDCGIAKKILDKNKNIINDKLSSIIKKNYTVCKKCNAGLGNVSFQNNTNKIIFNNLKYEPEMDPIQIEKYLSSIEDVSKWYVEHIPTYMRHLQEENIDDYIGKNGEIETVELKNFNYPAKFNNKEFFYIKLDNISTTSIINKKNINVLRANPKAIKYYQNKFDEIDFDKLYSRTALAYYPNNIINDSYDDYKMPGDDCVRLMFSILNYAEPMFTNELGKLSKINWRNINSNDLTTNKKHIAYAMNKLGFEIYENEIYEKDLDKNSVIDVTIKAIDDNFKLQPGDILARDGHIHFYIGEAEDGKQLNFGWGKVNRDYPRKYKIEKFKNEKGVYGIKLTNDKLDSEIYTRVYRYVGEREEER